jgi:SAM-dependent methyltransferase
VGFDPAWLAARRRYDEAALDPAAVQAISAWGRSLPSDRAPVVVDLGSGTGAALDRAQRWLMPRHIEGYAVDQDAALLAQGAALLAGSRSGPDRRTSRGDQGAAFTCGEPVIQLVGDLLEPLPPLGGPADGTVDLVLGHALADLLPLDALAARVAALVRPGGLVHLALAYDGVTLFGSSSDGAFMGRPFSMSPDGALPTESAEVTSPSASVAAREVAEIEAAVICQFHRHMDRRQASIPNYGGSTSGRRLAAALSAAGLEIVCDALSVWQVAATDGPDGERVLGWLLRFVAEAAREMDTLPPRDLARWEDAQRLALAAGLLTARVEHRDVLARRPL